VTPIFEANMDAGLRSHYRRAGAELADTRMPFDALLAIESADDGIDGGDKGPSDYEMRQRVIGVRTVFGLIKSRGVSMGQMMRQLFAVGRSLNDPFFSSLTMAESAMMFSETKAAHSWRCKVLSGKIKLQGMKGHRLPGQKTPESRAAYAAAATGNSNRARQSSFLRKLAAPGKPKQRTFTRKLNGTPKEETQPVAAVTEKKIA
jgi:hypothetical protein